MLIGNMNGPCRVELVDAPEPALTPGAAGEVLFEPELGCLCGSDLPFFRGSDEWPISQGQSLHEMIGRVAATSGERFCAGDRVLCVPVEHHGLCERYVVSEDRCLPVDPRCSDEEAVLAQPLGTAIFALKKLPSLVDLDVAIVGQGPMGQLFNICCRALGARRVIAIDQLDSRLETSAKTGAAIVICNARQDPAAEVRRLTGGRGADVVVEAVGHAEQQLNLCIDLLAYGGKLLYFGIPPATVDGVRWRDFVYKNAAIFGSVNPDFRRDFPLAMQWIAERRVDVRPLATHRFPLARIQEAFETFHDRRDGAIKVFVEFPALKRNASRTTGA